MRTISADDLAAIWPEAVVVDVRNAHPATYAAPVAEHPQPAGRRPLAAALIRIFKRTSR